jgi:N-acetylornithine carbamoyltransferase
VKDFYDLSESTRHDVERLVARALSLRNGSKTRRFEGKAIGLLFFNPSLRTQASFQRASQKLGLELVQLQSGGNGVWGIEVDDGAVMDAGNAEHVREAAAVLGRFVDVLCIRSFAGGASLERDLADPLVNGFRRFAGVPIVNMESALWHPCQALADWTTLEQYEVPRRAKFVLTWAWHPKALPHAVPNSTLCMAAQRGMDVVVLRPRGYDLHPNAIGQAYELAALNGGSVEITDDREQALAGAKIVYAKSWASLETYGNAAKEAELRAPLRGWCVTPEWLARTDGARFMHCLPVRRNVVVSDAVLDGPASIVIDQAENRLHAQTALLENLFASLEQKPKARASTRQPLEIER